MSIDTSRAAPGIGRASAKLLDRTLMALAGVALLSGAANAKCAAYVVPSSWSLKQGNGYTPTVKMKVSKSGKVSGSASYRTGDDFHLVVGEINSGTFDGHHLEFRVDWSGTSRGDYQATVRDSDQKLKGTTHDLKGGPTVNFTSVQALKCKV